MNDLFIYDEEELLFLKEHTYLDLIQLIYFKFIERGTLSKEIEYKMRVNNWIINSRKAWRKYLEDEPLGYSLEEFARITLDTSMKNNTIKKKKK